MHHPLARQMIGQWLATERLAILVLPELRLPWLFAPLIVAIINGKPGGGSWKFLSFLLCLGVAGLIFVDYLVPAIILWGLAWACAATARTQVHRRSIESRHADAFAGTK